MLEGPAGSLVEMELTSGVGAPSVVVLTRTEMNASHDSSGSGGELLGYAAEGMLRTNAERVGEAVEEQHTMETAAAALGRRLALAELAEKSEGGTAMPPNPRLRGRGRGGGVQVAAAPIEATSCRKLHRFHTECPINHVLLFLPSFRAGFFC